MASDENINLELISLIWLDRMVDATQENREIQDKLRSIVNHLRTFDNCRECEFYIENTINDKQDKIIFIVSGALGEEIVPRIHHLRQIISIFVFCMDKEKNKLWANRYKKVRGVFVELDDLLEEINVDCKSEEHKLNESIELIRIEDDQIIPLLLQIDSSLMDKRHLLQICSNEYQGNITELKNVEEFEHLYSSSNALDYFFNQTFLYRLLIKSLQIFNIDILFLLRFFLRDIHEQLKYCPAVSEPVYRGQLMDIDQIEFITQSIGQQLFRFNSFIIAYTNEEQVTKSLQNSPNTNGLHKVLFQIDINQIGKQYKQFILFPITTYFRIRSVNFRNRIWIVTIIIYNSNQSKNTKKGTPIELAHRLRAQGQLDEAEKLFNRLLIQYPSLNAQCYDGLGHIAQDKGLYKTSLNFYIKSLETVSFETRGNCLNNIGCAYYYLEEYDKALEYYFESLKLMLNDINRSMCLNNIGIIYAQNEQYEEALQFFQHSLSIREKLSSETNPDLGVSYTNLGVLCSSIDQLDLALDYYQRSLKFFSSKNCLKFRALVYQNMALIFEERNQFDRALTVYRNAEKICKEVRPIDHSNLIHIRQIIDQLKQKQRFVF